MAHPALNILTAVTRPYNLGVIAESIAAAAAKAPQLELAWHWKLDPDGAHIGGQEIKNGLLDAVRGGFVHFLDDDTLMHEDLLMRFKTELEAEPRLRALVVAQSHEGVIVRTASAENACIGGIDIGQAILKRSLIGDRRLQPVYVGDGIFLEQILQDGSHVVFVDEPLSLYNALR